MYNTLYSVTNQRQTDNQMETARERDFAPLEAHLRRVQACTLPPLCAESVSIYGVACGVATQTVRRVVCA